MAIKTKTELKSFFEKGDFPSEAEFGHLIDTLFRKEKSGLLTLNAAGTSGHITTREAGSSSTVYDADIVPTARLVLAVTNSTGFALGAAQLTATELSISAEIIGISGNNITVEVLADSSYTSATTIVQGANSTAINSITSKKWVIVFPTEYKLKKIFALIKSETKYCDSRSDGNVVQYCSGNGPIDAAGAGISFDLTNFINIGKLAAGPLVNGWFGNISSVTETGFKIVLEKRADGGMDLDSRFILTEA